MRKLIITQWMSLDGIFDADSMDKWWAPFDSESRQKYIQDTINSCDIMLYGRTTYDMLYPYWSSFKHNEQGVADKLNKGRKYVVSSKLKKAAWKNTNIINKNFTQEVEKLKKEEGGPILVQGSASLIKPLMDAGMVDELKLLINPAIIGEGARTFTVGSNRQLEFVQCQPFEKNVILLTYNAVK